MNRDLPPDENTKAIKFMLKENLGRYKLNNRGKKLKTIIYDNKEYRYNPEKPISKKLEKKLETFKKTNEYKAHKVKQEEAFNTVKKHVIKKKATINETASAFRAYANSYTISNISLKGLNGLSYFPYQFEKFNEYLKEHKGMKLIATIKLKVHNLFEESREVIVRTRQYPITNEEGLRKALDGMRPDIEIRFQDMALNQSGLMIDKIEKIHIMYNRYNPTRAGSYIPLPKHISSKKACINIKNTDDKCFKYAIECGFYKVYEKFHLRIFTIIRS